MERKLSSDEASGNGGSCRSDKRAGRWAKEQKVEAIPAFASLRGLPPHLLLGDLKRELLCSCTGAAASHFQGLAQAGRRLGLPNPMASKLRLVDDAHYLLKHLSPESATISLGEVCSCLERVPSGGAQSGDENVAGEAESGDLAKNGDEDVAGW